MKDMEVHVIKNGYTAPKQAMIHTRYALDPRAAFAMELMKSAMCNSLPKDPLQLANLCAAASESAFARWNELGWVAELPSWDDLNEDPPTRPGFGSQHE